VTARELRRDPADLTQVEAQPRGNRGVLPAPGLSSAHRFFPAVPKNVCRSRTTCQECFTNLIDESSFSPIRILRRGTDRARELPLVIRRTSAIFHPIAGSVPTIRSG